MNQKQLFCIAALKIGKDCSKLIRKNLKPGFYLFNNRCRLENDKIVLNRLEELLNQYEIDTFVIGMPINMNGTKTERVEVTEKFIHKLKCRFPKIMIETIDERLTTVEAHKTMNFLDINKKKKRAIVDTISAVYILETYMKKIKN
jgi:putative Holliday junction resolvase